MPPDAEMFVPCSMTAGKGRYHPEYRKDSMCTARSIMKSIGTCMSTERDTKNIYPNLRVYEFSVPLSQIRK